MMDMIDAICLGVITYLAMGSAVVAEHCGDLPICN